jgi:hypothetical protein
MPQASAKSGKARHKAKARLKRFLLDEMRAPASESNEPQRAATVSSSAC